MMSLVVLRSKHTTISVRFRPYIEGRPLSETLRRLTPKELDHYKLQINAIVREAAMVTSDCYGSILDGNLKTYDSG